MLGVNYVRLTAFKYGNYGGEIEKNNSKEII